MLCEVSVSSSDEEEKEQAAAAGEGENIVETKDFGLYVMELAERRAENEEIYIVRLDGRSGVLHAMGRKKEEEESEMKEEMNEMDNMEDAR